jgi:hypothetical protein
MTEAEDAQEVRLQVGALIVNCRSAYIPRSFNLPWGGTIEMTTSASAPFHAFLDDIDPFSLKEISETDHVAVTIDTNLESKVIADASRRAAITALRLTKLGWVGAPLQWEVYWAGDQAHVSGWSQNWDLARQNMSRLPRVDFGQNDLDLIADVLPQLLDMRSATTQVSKRISTAVRRLAWAVERPRIEDQLVDWSIAMEALFASQGDYAAGRNIRDQISQRACLYLSEGIKPGAKTLLELANCYDLRNYLVHGDDPGVDLHESANLMGSVVRRSIRKALREPGSLEAILEI